MYSPSTGLYGDGDRTGLVQTTVDHEPIARWRNHQMGLHRVQTKRTHFAGSRNSYTVSSLTFNTHACHKGYHRKRKKKCYREYHRKCPKIGSQRVGPPHKVSKKVQRKCQRTTKKLIVFQIGQLLVILRHSSKRPVRESFKHKLNVCNQLIHLTLP